MSAMLRTSMLSRSEDIRLKEIDFSRFLSIGFDPVSRPQIVHRHVQIQVREQRSMNKDGYDQAKRLSKRPVMLGMQMMMMSILNTRDENKLE